MRTILTSITAGSLLAMLAMAQPPRYSVIDLGALPDGTSSSANALNNNRLVGGNAADANGTQQNIFWWGPLTIKIGTPGLNSGIFGVNDGGMASINAEISKKDPNNENFCGFGTGLECLAFLLQGGIRAFAEVFAVAIEMPWTDGKSFIAGPRREPRRALDGMATTQPKRPGKLAGWSWRCKCVDIPLAGFPRPLEAMKRGGCGIRLAPYRCA